MRRVAGALLLVSHAAIAGEIAPGQRQSGYASMAAEIRAMQDNDKANPGMLWVAEGARLWSEPGPDGRPACRTCHGEAETSMRGVAARYPAARADGTGIRTLEAQINACRTERQGGTPLAPESRPLLALTTLVSHQSRGLALSPGTQPALVDAQARGKALFSQRMGQLNLSCAGCHDDNWGRRLGASLIPQGHPNGYPIYRLEWQGLGSLQRRLRNCMTGIRAEPFPPGSAELADLEAYLALRASGLTVETPAVRP